MQHQRAESDLWRPAPRKERPRPLVGVTTDVVEPAPGKPRAMCPMTYCRAVAAAGGLPILLPPDPALAAEHAQRFDAFVLIGGDDPRTEPFGEPTHPKATPVHPLRQEYDTALLRALEQRPNAPVLGVCLGMQMMALLHGGRLHQHLPEVISTADKHTGDLRHPLKAVLPAPPAGSGGSGGGGVRAPASLHVPADAVVTSHHHQAVRDPGRLRVIAVAEDGVIEATDHPSRPFYIGVQWHPERTEDARLGLDLFKRLVQRAMPDDAAR